MSAAFFQELLREDETWSVTMLENKGLAG